jgi:hypothetical protein
MGLGALADALWAGMLSRCATSPAVHGVEGVDAPHPSVSLPDAAGGVCARVLLDARGVLAKENPARGGVVDGSSRISETPARSF